VCGQQLHALAALPPGGTLEPIEYKAGWTPEPVWTVLEHRKKFLLQPGYEVARIKKKVSVGKQLGRRSLEISVQIWEDNIKMDSREIIYGDGWLFGLRLFLIGGLVLGVKTSGSATRLCVS
jgi:hypothetical protein